MKFRLTYTGELRPTQDERSSRGATPLADHKHQIRRAFHAQLRHLWAVEPFLSTAKFWPSDFGHPAITEEELGPWKKVDSQKMVPMSELVAEKYKEFGYRFLPLVRESMGLHCSLHILFLRRDPPGHALSAGDIDNRIKTLIDALRRPRNRAELFGNDQPRADEDPFYCLMEDDKQVTHFSVETDTLLDPPGDDEVDVRRVQAIITVELRPYYVTMFNMSFA